MRVHISDLTNVLMVVLTAAYVIVTTRLLRAVKLQADIAKAQSDHLVNLERAWLLVTIVDRYDYPRTVRPGESRVSGALFVVKNYGKSPAWITEMGGNFVTVNSLSDLPPEPDYKTVTDAREKGIVVVPITVEGGDQQSFHFPHESKTDVTAQFSSALKQEILWCVYGFVAYKDVFG